MAVEQVAVQELPFRIEPLSPKRLQLWSRFAGQATTDTDMWIVRNVYYAFYWEMRAQTVLEHVLLWHQSLHSQSNAEVLVLWLNSLVTEQVTLRDTYDQIATQIADCEKSYARYYKDIDERLVAVVNVLDVIRQYGVSLCYEWHLVIPQQFVQESSSPTVPAAGEGGERL
jgi:hypothetical protein